MAQEKLNREQRKGEAEVAEAVGAPATNGAGVANPETAERHEKLTEDVDALLDEIDDVLETNAEDFVRGFVQKGGE